MKTFDKHTFSVTECEKELQEFKALLSANSELDERKEILPFFRQRRHLSSFIATYVNDIINADRLAFEFNYWNPKYREFPILLICEEAHAYIPHASESQFAGSRKSMERIAKEGRKYGVGLAVVSQRPHEVSETVLAQCGTFICLRITNPDDQAYVRSLVPESEGDLVSVLAGLGRGEALVLGEAVPLPTRLQFDKPNPSPNSDDVDFYAKWIDGPTDLDVDAIVKRWRSQER